MSKATALERATFQTSRLLDFCSEKGLIAQTGHQPNVWPLVILKELMDNSLDACEEARVAPEIHIKVDKKGIQVSDNGPGIRASTVKAIQDYSIRVSSREAYVAPDRGAQGNALKTILAMPYVLDGERGIVEIEAQEIRHEIIFRADNIRQAPAIDYQPHPAAKCKKGTAVRVYLPIGQFWLIENCVSYNLLMITPGLTLISR